MARYYVIEMWEEQEVPSFSTFPTHGVVCVDCDGSGEISKELRCSTCGGSGDRPKGDIGVFTTDDYQDALDEQGEMQDGYILDFQECKIIKP